VNSSVPVGSVSVSITRSINDEVWVQVTGDEGTPDLPTLRGSLPPDIARLPLKRYVPGSAIHGQWTMEDWWILDATSMEVA